VERLAGNFKHVVRLYLFMDDYHTGISYRHCAGFPALTSTIS